MEEYLKGLAGELRVDMSWAKEDYPDKRFETCNRQSAEITVVCEDHTILGICQLKQSNVVCPSKITTSHVDNIATLGLQFGYHVRVDILIRKPSEVFQLQRFTSAVIRTSFFKKCVAYRNDSSTSSATN